MNLRRAMLIASNYIIFGDPNGEIGSFDPLGGEYMEETDTWRIICQYKKNGIERKATVVIDNKTEEILSFKVIEESRSG